MKVEDYLYPFLGIYKKAPIPVKKATAALYNRLPNAVRYGRSHARFEDLVRRTRAMTRTQIRAYQLAHLNELLRAAVDHVPHYNDVLAGLELPVTSLEAFTTQVPLLTKEELRANPDRFLHTDYDRSTLIPVATGGTTGEPLKLYYEKGITRTKELVFLNDMWSRIGYRPGDLRAVFRSALVRDRTMTKLWEYDPIKNRYFFSSHDLTRENLPAFVDKLHEIRPAFLHVYPSALTILASYMKANGLGPIAGVRGILCGSENAYPHQIRLFEDVFQCRVLRWYGLGEMSALMGSCEYDYHYHTYPTYSFVELIDEDGNPVREPGATGEIVGSSFHNFAMPLLRYRTGDRAVYHGEDHYGLVLREVEGRAQEYIVDREGNLLSLGPFIFGIHEEFWHNVSAIQFHQREAGALEIHGASHVLDDDVLAAYLLRTFRPRFAGRFEISVRAVDGFARSRSSKHAYLVQHLDVAGPDPGTSGDQARVGEVLQEGTR